LLTCDLDLDEEEESQINNLRYAIAGDAAAAQTLIERAA
jgi:hypothetical protein